MPTSVTMPALGESVTEGTVTRWLKQEGDQVQADEPLLEVSTDKVDTEIPSPVSGTLLSITVREDETVEVGAELGVIGEPGEGGGDSGAADSGDEQSGGDQSGGDQSGGGGGGEAVEESVGGDDQAAPPDADQSAAEAEYAAAEEQDQPAASDQDGDQSGD